jgi:amidase
LVLSAADIGAATRARADLFRRTVAFFETYDLLICPTVLTPPFNHEIHYLTEFEGTKFDNYVDWLILTFVITLTSCPTISVPCGFTRDGLPVGLQIMGPPRADAEVLAAAALVEQTSGLANAVPIDPRPHAIPPD